jgi:hypothetical protein
VTLSKAFDKIKKAWKFSFTKLKTQYFREISNKVRKFIKLSEPEQVEGRRE